jgi:hypothetical protein
MGYAAAYLATPFSQNSGDAAHNQGGDPLRIFRDAGRNTSYWARINSNNQILGNDFFWRPAVASFGVHLAGGLCLAGVAATSVLVAGLASPMEMLAYLALGTVGSLLPDIDADNSAPIQISFTVISIALAFGAMFVLADTFDSVVELLAVWLCVYLLFRWLVFHLFTRLTTHRGIFHSVPAALLFGATTTLVADHVLGRAVLQAWLAGLFVCFGYLVHLLLDELYSVNLFGMRTRRSLGSAFKLWSSSNHAASLYMYTACLLILPLLPDHRPLVQAVYDEQAFEQLAGRITPADGWFRFRRNPTDN